MLKVCTTSNEGERVQGQRKAQDKARDKAQDKEHAEQLERSNGILMIYKTMLTHLFRGKLSSASSSRWTDWSSRAGRKASRRATMEIS